MSSIPSICPNCYRNIHAPVMMPDGFIRCDGCGHAFPPAGSSPYASSPALGPPHTYGAPPQQPYGSAPATTPVGGAPFGAPGYQPSYPPPSGPQKPGNPGLMACGVAALLGVLFMGCCGGVAFFAYRQAKQVADQIPNQNFPAPLPGMPQPAPMPVFPNTPDPFIGPGPAIPGFPQPAAEPQTVDEILAAMRTASPSDFRSHQWLQRLANMQVVDARRGEVVTAILRYMEVGGFSAAHAARPALAKWASKAESIQLARFAAGNADFTARKVAIDVLAETGCTTEGIALLPPLLEQHFVSQSVKGALIKFGADSEDAVLAQLDTSKEPHARRLALEILGEVGTAKSRAKLQALAEQGDGLDKIFGQRALQQLQSRGK